MNPHIAVTIRRHDSVIGFRLSSTPGGRLRLAVAALIAAAALASVVHTLDRPASARGAGVAVAAAHHVAPGLTHEASRRPRLAFDNPAIAAFAVIISWLVLYAAREARIRTAMQFAGRGNATRRGPPALAIP